MAISDGLKRPAGIECPKWFPVKLGGKKCRDYIDNGACKRGDEFMCVEWVFLHYGYRPMEQPSQPATQRRQREPAPILGRLQKILDKRHEQEKLTGRLRALLNRSS